MGKPNIPVGVLTATSQWYDVVNGHIRPRDFLLTQPAYAAVPVEDDQWVDGLDCRCLFTRITSRPQFSRTFWVLLEPFLGSASAMWKAIAFSFSMPCAWRASAFMGGVIVTPVSKQSISIRLFIPFTSACSYCATTLGRTISIVYAPQDEHGGAFCAGTLNG